MKEALRKELEKQIPEIAEQYIENIESFLEFLKSTYGKGLIVEGNRYSSFKGEDDSWVTPRQHERAKSKFREYRGKGLFVNKNPLPKEKRLYKLNNGENWEAEYLADVSKSEWVLNKEATMPEAVEYAKRAVRAWEDKIIEKLGDLKEIEVPFYHGSYFVISGKRKNQEVSIHQQMIVNYRYETHAIFNQFPARIYVDGKSMSASKYSKHFQG